MGVTFNPEEPPATLNDRRAGAVSVKEFPGPPLKMARSWLKWRESLATLSVAVQYMSSLCQLAFQLMVHARINQTVGVHAPLAAVVDHEPEPCAFNRASCDSDLSHCVVDHEGVAAACQRYLDPMHALVKQA